MMRQIPGNQKRPLSVGSKGTMGAHETQVNMSKLYFKSQIILPVVLLLASGPLFKIIKDPNNLLM